MYVYLYLLKRRGNANSAELNTTKGFHVVKVIPNSPASKAQIEAYFDFVLGVEGLRLVNFVFVYSNAQDEPNDDFSKVLQSFSNLKKSSISLVIYNLKRNSIRGMHCLVQLDY